MAIGTEESQNAVTLDGGVSPSQKEIHETVFVALQSRQHDRAPERRNKLRRPFPYPVYLSPTTDLEQTITVLGKHISEQGLDFYSNEALPHRKMIASIDLGDGHWVAFELTLNWCRFGRHGWYENGGKFTKVVDSPIGASIPNAESASTA